MYRKAKLRHGKQSRWSIVLREEGDMNDGEEEDAVQLDLMIDRRQVLSIVYFSFSMTVSHAPSQP